MRNYALITTALSVLLLGLTVSPKVYAEEALAGTLPGAATASTPAEASATAGQVFMPAAASGAAPAPSTPTATASASTSVPEATPTVATPTLPSSPSGTVSSATTTNSLPPVSPANGGTEAITLPPSSGAITGSVLSGSSTNNLTTSPAVPQIVQDAMTRLQKTDQINLDDMIRAQDAINRLDLLLEIEKRQSELKKIRDERNKPAASSLLGSAIPASALNLPKLQNFSAPSLPSASSDSDSASARSSSSDRPKNTSSDINEKYSIRRITGADGRYVAIINTGDGASQTVRTGEKLPDGSVVKSITLTSVALSKEKKSKTLTIPTDSYIVRESGNTME